MRRARWRTCTLIISLYLRAGRRGALGLPQELCSLHLLLLQQIQSSSAVTGLPLKITKINNNSISRGRKAEEGHSQATIPLALPSFFPCAKPCAMALGKNKRVCKCHLNVVCFVLFCFVFTDSRGAARK